MVSYAKEFSVALIRISRRDSDLIKVIEEDVLKHAHRKVMMPLFQTRRKHRLPPMKVSIFTIFKFAAAAVAQSVKRP